MKELWWPLTKECILIPLKSTLTISNTSWIRCISTLPFENSLSLLCIIYIYIYICINHILILYIYVHYIRRRVSYKLGQVLYMQIRNSNNCALRNNINCRVMYTRILIPLLQLLIGFVSQFFVIFFDSVLMYYILRFWCYLL